MALLTRVVNVDPLISKSKISNLRWQFMFHKSFSFLDPGRLPTTLFMMTIAIQEVITNPDITKIAVVATDQTEVVTTREDLGKSILRVWNLINEFCINGLNMTCRMQDRMGQGRSRWEGVLFCVWEKNSLRKSQFFIWLIHLENILHILKTGPSIPWKYLSTCRRDNISYYLSNCFFNWICFSF